VRWATTGPNVSSASECQACTITLTTVKCLFYLDIKNEGADQYICVNGEHVIKEYKVYKIFVMIENVIR
jgi:hypothetical protein